MEDGADAAWLVDGEGTIGVPVETHPREFGAALVSIVLEVIVSLRRFNELTVRLTAILSFREARQEIVHEYAHVDSLVFTFPPEMVEARFEGTLCPLRFVGVVGVVAE